MDLQLIRTFLEVAATGSFGAASGRLYVTQSAVSLRVHRLEEQLGRPLFDRTKSGVTLTPAGREFRGFATSIIRNWEQARQRVGSLDKAPTSLVIGAESTLWPRFGFKWLDRLRDENPHIQIRAVLAEHDGLVQMALSGEVQVVLSHSSIDRPGMHSDRLIEEQLVMVCPWPDATVESVSQAYALVDWGSDFLRFHETSLPLLSDPKLILTDGSMAAWFIRSRPLAAYLPVRLVQASPDDRSLNLVTDAPIYTLTSWAVWREDLDSALRLVARKALDETLAEVSDAASKVLDQM